MDSVYGLSDKGASNVSSFLGCLYSGKKGKSVLELFTRWQMLLVVTP